MFCEERGGRVKRERKRIEVLVINDERRRRKKEEEVDIEGSAGAVGMCLGS